MNSPFFPVQQSILSAQALALQVLPTYSFKSPITCELFNRGVNHIYLVRSGESKCILRISRTGWRTYEQIAGEVDFLNFLAKHDFPVAKPIPKKDGSYIHTLNAPEGVRYAVALTYVEGNPPFKLNRAQSERYGQLTAKIHLLSDQHQKQISRYHYDLDTLVDEALKRFVSLYADRPQEVDYLMEIGERLKAEANKLPRRGSEYGICHGDLRSENLLLDKAGEFTLIDFDDCGYGWRVYDIGTFFWHQFFPAPIDQQGEIRDAFLSGYQSVRPLSDAELKALPYFVALRHIWSCGVGTEQVPLDVGTKRIFQYLEPVLQWLKGWMAQIE